MAVSMMFRRSKVGSACVTCNMKLMDFTYIMCLDILFGFFMCISIGDTLYMHADTNVE